MFSAVSIYNDAKLIKPAQAALLSKGRSGTFAQNLNKCVYFSCAS